MTAQHDLERWSPLLTVAVVVVDAVLLATGVVTARGALLLVVLVELPLLILTLAALAIAVRAQRRVGSTLRTVLGRSPIAPVVRAELRTYASLVRWILRRPAVPRGATALPATEGVLTVPVAFSIVTVIELVALDIILPWWWVRVLVVLVSLWSLVMLWGIVSLRVTSPHVLTDSHLILRQSGRLVARIDRGSITRVAPQRRFSPTKPEVDGERLALPGPNGTVLDLALAEPITAGLPGYFGRPGTTGEVEVISLHLDDPAVLIAALSVPQPRR